MKQPRIDPISLNIHWTRLVSMVDEASITFRRTCFSTLVREANDFAVILTDAAGHSIAQSSMSIPSFIGTLPETVKAFLERFPAETLSPGDFIVTNDPWMGTGHVYDMSGVMPLFHGGRLVGFAAVASHLADVGGRIWGTGAREIFEEGLQLPPIKLLHAGEPDPAIVAIIEQNVRVPTLTLGDIWGQVAACRMLESRLAEFLDETGVGLDALGHEVRRRSERAMRDAIGTLPDGIYENAVYQDGFEGGSVRIAVAVKVDGTRMHIDYAGSSPQLPRAVNVVPAYRQAYSAYAVKCLIEPEVPNNEGSFEPITTSAPAGSIFNPAFPAATGGRHIIGQMVVFAIVGALAPVLGERAQAEGSPVATTTLNGTHLGRRFNLVSFMCSGQGASATRGGRSTISFPTNVGNTPIEVVEQTAPVLVKRRAIRRRSGGEGARRGGDGGVFEFEYVGDEPGLVSFQLRCRDNPPRGRAGGEGGKPAKLTLNGRSLETSADHVIVRGDRVRLETAGGGGYGSAG